MGFRSAGNWAGTGAWVRCAARTGGFSQHAGGRRRRGTAPLRRGQETLIPRNANQVRGPPRKRSRRTAPKLFFYSRDVARGRAFLPFNDLELDLLALVQRLESISPDGRVVHEAVATTVILLEEPKAFLLVEPFHLPQLSGVVVPQGRRPHISWSSCQG